jgi:FkbM family methyltransferase
MKIDSKNLNISKKINYDKLSPENEKNKSKLSNNLRKHVEFLEEDIILKENSLVIDMGANIGDITSIFSRMGCVVHSFEPTKETYGVLEKRFSKNDNVFTYNKACWNKNEKLKFYHHEWCEYNKIHWSNGNSLLVKKRNVKEDDYEEVEAIDVTEFICSLSTQIDLIKIDIEGAEIEVINHIIDSGAINKVDKIICEVHDKKYDFLKTKTMFLKKKIRDKGLQNKINLEWH